MFTVFAQTPVKDAKTGEMKDKVSAFIVERSFPGVSRYGACVRERVTRESGRFWTCSTGPLMLLCCERVRDSLCVSNIATLVTLIRPASGRGRLLLPDLYSELFAYPSTYTHTHTHTHTNHTHLHTNHTHLHTNHTHLHTHAVVLPRRKWVSRLRTLLR